MRPTAEEVRAAPKVLLHDHLDGGLRPQTLIELAGVAGYSGLPTSDADELARWMVQGASRLDLVLYLEMFAHTVAVTQTASALERVAAECVEDLDDDGVVYAEVRFAPELHTEAGLSMGDAVEAVLAGFEAASAGRAIRVETLLTALRANDRSTEVAQLAVSLRDRGVVGFDLAGPEAGNPATEHLDAFHLIQRENFHHTIHAGEGSGRESIWEALQYCGAERLGHGVRIVDDIDYDSGATPRLGRLAAYVRDRRIPLELCPSSNVHTGAALSMAEHPIRQLFDLGFRVTVNTDNRLMSGTSMTREVMQLVDHLGFGWAEIERLAVNAMKSAFIGWDERVEIINTTIEPAYRTLRR